MSPRCGDSWAGPIFRAALLELPIRGLGGRKHAKLLLDESSVAMVALAVCTGDAGSLPQRRSRMLGIWVTGMAVGGIPWRKFGMLNGS
ncbi:MAG: hypothetical protein MJD61_12540 [Proteobacteria bacterium]|nr:hypothetical protein [Pseudomonadota bacterium]